MSMQSYFVRLGLVLGIGNLFLSTAHADQGRAVTLHGAQGSGKALAAFMKAQKSGTHMRLSVDSPPPLKSLLPLLPKGTKLLGSLIVLPSGADFVLVQARTKVQEQASSAHPETRAVLISHLQQLKSKGLAGKAMVKFKRPTEPVYKTIGNLDRAILEAPYLPNGTMTMIVLPNAKTPFQFGPVAGEPVFPKPHTGRKPTLRWAQQTTSGRWQEEPIKTQTGLHWVQRRDGYWEEEPIKE